MRAARLLAALALSAVLAGCASSGGHLALISTEIPEGIDLSTAVHVEGENYGWVALGFGGLDDQMNVEKAVRRALEKAPGTNLLLNARLTRTVTGLDGVCCMRGVIVEGEAVRYVPRR